MKENLNVIKELLQLESNGVKILLTEKGKEFLGSNLQIERGELDAKDFERLH